MNRRTVMGLGAAAAGAAGLEAQAAPIGPVSLTADRGALKAIRVVTSPSGASVIEDVEFRAKERAFFYGGEIRDYLNFEASKVSIFTAPANIDLPFHGVETFCEMFYVLRGTSTLILRDGTRREVSEGMFIFLEDANSTGRAGRTGPDGYSVISATYTLADKPAILA